MIEELKDGIKAETSYTNLRDTTFKAGDCVLSDDRKRPWNIIDFEKLNYKIFKIISSFILKAYKILREKRTIVYPLEIGP